MIDDELVFFFGNHRRLEAAQAIIFVNVELVRAVRQVQMRTRRHKPEKDF